MQVPALTDTIVAVATGWSPATLGIVRVSGPDAEALLAAVGLSPPAPSTTDAAGARSAAAVVTHGEVALPGVPRFRADALWFRAPRSYTGQDLVELHTTGCLPLLRATCDALIAAGGRRALPGEFTARAFLAGKLSRAQVSGVLALVEAEDAAAARRAARMAHGVRDAAVAQLAEGVLELLTQIEAGIDFVEEEDIRFVTAAQVQAAVDRLIHAADALCDDDAVRGLHAVRPRVALVGLPNAGKSTLFNALLGTTRAIVSPVVGTTRDVLSCEVRLGGVTATLQDCAGLGAGREALDLAAHEATEAAADQADLVLWVHAADRPWSDDELAALARIPVSRRAVVYSKCDLPEQHVGPSAPPPDLRVSVARDPEVRALRDYLGVRLSGQRGVAPVGDGVAAARGALRSAAVAAARARGEDLAAPELVALDLRAAYEALRGVGCATTDEQVLAGIFSRFCIGK